MPCLLSSVFIIAYRCSLIYTYKFPLFCILQVCLGTFTVLFGAFVAFGATYTTAQSAWAADAFGGAFTSSQVAADRRQQSADWVKITTTSRKQREPHALTEAQTEIEQLKRELKQVESSQKAMHEGERAGTRGSKQSNDQEKTKRRNKDGWRDRCCACVS